MELSKVRVTNFRSVEDSDEFEIDQITCLVGKNEAGKSAVLQAIAGLKPHPATPFSYNKERDYPRRFLTNYAERHSSKAADVVQTEWKIPPDDNEAIVKKFGSAALISDIVKLTRRYGEDIDWALPIDCKAAIQHMMSEHKLNVAEKNQLSTAENSQSLVEAMGKLSAPSEKQKALLADLQSLPDKTVTGKVKSILNLPSFMYFSSYDRMAGEISLGQLQTMVADGSINHEANKGMRLFYEFIEYAGVTLDDIVNAQTFETFNAKLQAASNAITDQMQEYWSQNPDISIQINVSKGLPGDPAPFNEGTVARARIYNALHRVDVPFSERSQGFIWFFSFLIKFEQIKRANQSTILLLDEPGLTLHGKAQGDLLRFFEEKLSPKHQIIYSTHSPFMVPPDKLTSARIVEDVVAIKAARRVPIGTKVSGDVLAKDPDSVFPLQGALGYEITQTLFVGKNTLLVEGVSDILYMKAFSSALAKRKLTALDTRWTICPSGGIGNIRPFVSLFKGNSLNIAVVTDFAQGDKRKIEALKESNVLRSGAVFTLDVATGKAEADVEDLFEVELFVDLLNQCYNLTGADVLTTIKLDTADATTVRLVKKAEAYFRVMGSHVPNFDHYRPAEWLIENPSFLTNKSKAHDATLSRVANLFTEINKLV